MRNESGNEQYRPEAGQSTCRRQMDLNELAKMSLEELLYFVLVGDGRRLQTEML